jgi:hypothetical protein
LDSKGIDVVLGIGLVKQAQYTHRMCQGVCQADYTGWEGIEYIAEPIVTAKGAVNRVKLNKFDASQGPEVPVVNEFFDVLPEELSVMPPDRDIKSVIE